MGWMEFILAIATLVFGGGWFVYYRANKMKAYGEAWESQQHVYQNTIEDLEKSCEFIRSDRDLLRKENEELRKENQELRNKINEHENIILDIKKEMARQGRRLDSILPFSCGVAGCPNRARVELQDKNNAEN